MNYAKTDIMKWFEGKLYGCLLIGNAEIRQKNRERKRLCKDIYFSITDECRLNRPALTADILL